MRGSMNEENNNLTPTEPGTAEFAREVVLRYSPEPRPVEERYVAPLPLPGRRLSPGKKKPAKPADWEDEEDWEEAGHSHTGTRLFLACMGLLMVILAGLGIQSMRHRSETIQQQQQEVSPSSPSYRYETEWTGKAETPSETTIERYPTGTDVRLRYDEEAGQTLSIQEIYERVNPCTVTVATVLPGGSAIIGAGVIFTPDGYIITNAHVVEGGTECYAVLDASQNGRTLPARLIGMDIRQDLAVIKVDAENLPTASFGDSDSLSVGDTVYAIGNPLGVQLRGTLTNGIVSAINRDVLVDGVRMTLLQTNAALNSGNSGGPLINTYGQVVGINTMKIGSNSAVSVEGLGFAIPVSSAAWMIDQLIAYGEVRGEPVLGISVLRESITLPDGESALQIYEITPGSAAARAGLETGDCIIRADGEPLHSVNDLLRLRRRYGVDETLKLEIERYNQRLTVDVVLTPLP